MRFEVLGTLRVRDEHDEVPIGGPMRRRLLAALLCRGDRPVRAEELIDDLWGEAPPRSAAKTLQSHVTRLRDDLGRGRADVLVTTDAGYHLDLTVAEVDADRFQRALQEARDVAERDPGRAALLLREGLALWRDDAYADVGDASFAVVERLRLAELRGAAFDLCVDLELRLGRSAALIPELEARVAAEPFRERAWEQLMLALYLSGRQADALAAYRRVRDLLAGELGVDPGDRLRELEGRILRQDPTLAAAPPEPADVVQDPNACPYRGLAGYADRDAVLFVGRERLTADLAGLIADNRIVVVTGPSGSGKSSLLHAGLLPALRAGALPGSAGWRTAIRQPRDVDEGDRLDLLVLDQAEELFFDDDRDRTVAKLRAIVESETRLVIAIRGDFVGRLAELGSLAGAARVTLLVRPMRDDEIRRVVTEPAQRCGLLVEPDLVDAVLDEISGQAAALPLLSVALVRAWEHRTDAVITVEGYRGGGGIAGALEATAEDVYLALPAEQATAARLLLPRLAVRQGTAWVRRSLARAAIRPGTESEVVEALSRGRLLTVTDERVEIVHDALLTRWPRLHDWLTERELVADLLDHLATTAHSWQQTRADSDLYRGARLQAARDWASEHELDPVEQEFLAASLAAADAELAEAKARADREAAGRRRLRVLVGALGLVLLLAVAVGVVALVERSSARHQAGRAERAALSADARRLAASSLTAPDLRTALLLATAAYRLQDSTATRSALLTSLETTGGLRWRIATSNRLQWLATDAAAETVWTFDNQQDVLVVDVATHRVVSTFPMQEFAPQADTVSPDGRLIVVDAGTGDNAPDGKTTVGGQVIVQDAHSGVVRAVLPVHAPATGFVTPPAAFTHDGRWLAVASDGDRLATKSGTRLLVFDAHDLAARPRVYTAAAPITGLAAGTGTLAVRTSAGDLAVLDATSLRVLHHAHRSDGSSDSSADGWAPLAISADGARVATALADPSSAAVLSADDLGGQGVRVSAGTGIDTLAFSPTGVRLAVGADSGALLVVNASSGAIENRLSDSGPVHGLAWGGRSDATGLFSGGLDSQLSAWELRQAPRMLSLTGPMLPGESLVNPAGRYVVGLTTIQSQKPALIWGRLPDGPIHIRPLNLPASDYVNGLLADGTGRRAVLSMAAANKTWCQVVDPVTGRMTTRLDVPYDAAALVGCSVSRDGRTLAVSTTRTGIEFYALPSLKRIKTVHVSVQGPNAARVRVLPDGFTPDGLLLVWGVDRPPFNTPAPRVGSTAAPGPPSDQLQLRIDPRTGRTTGQISLGAAGAPVDFEWNKAGTKYLEATQSGRVYLIDPRRFAISAQALTAAGFALSASFSPDDSLIVTAGSDGTMRFLDGRTLEPVGQPIGLPTRDWMVAYFAGNQVVGLAPVPDGQRWFRFPGDPATWARTACAVAGSSFSRAEWKQYVGDRPYQDVCATRR